MKLDIYNYIKQLWKELVVLFLLLIIGMLINIYIPQINSRYIDSLSENSFNTKIKMIIFILIAISLINTFIRFASNVINTVINTKMNYAFQNDVLIALKKIKFLKLKQFDSGYLIQRISTDCNIITDFLTHQIFGFIISTLQLITMMLLIGLINIAILIGVLLIILLYSILYIIFNKLVYVEKKHLVQKQNEYFSSLHKSIDDIKSIKIFSKYDFMKNMIASNYKDLLIQAIKYVKVTFYYESSGEIILIIFRVFLFYLGALLVTNGDLSIGQLLILLSYCSSLFECVNTIIDFSKNYMNYKVSKDRVIELFDFDTDDNGIMLDDNIKSISINNLSVDYNSKLIKYPDYSFHSNNIYLILGKNGSGKTTLFDILSGVNSVNYNGTVLLNKQNIKDINLIHYRNENIAICNQNTNFYSYITEEDRISLMTKISDERYLYLRKFVDKNKLISLFESSNFNVSGGENQKLAIVNTLLSDKEILLFDEPTSALDIDSIDDFKELLLHYSKDKIIIIITHNQKLMDISNCVLDLDTYVSKINIKSN